MRAKKITVALPGNQLEEVRSLVKSGQSAGVSEFVSHALAIALADAAGWREMLDQALQETGGPLSQQEREWADAMLSQNNCTSPPRETS